MLNITTENKRYGLLALLSHSTFCVVFAYYIMYLKSVGYSSSQVGVVSALSILVNISAQPIIGYLSDNIVGIKKIMIVIFTVPMVLAVFIPAAHSNFFLILGIILVISITGRNSCAALDIFIVKTARKKSGADYGFIRGMGSLGYAVTALILGYVLSKSGSSVIFVIYSVMMAVSLVCLVRLDDVPPEKIQKSAQKISFFRAILMLLKIPSYVLSIFAFFFTFLAVGANGIFNTVLVAEVGGTSFHLGMGLFICAISEVPVMLCNKKILKKFSMKTVLMFSLIVYILKTNLILWFPSVDGYIYTQFLQSVTYGLFMPTSLMYVSSIVPKKLTATAMMLSGALYGGISGITASYIGGLMIDRLGVLSIYKYGTVCCVIGAVLFLLNLLLFKNPPADEESVF